MASTFLTQALVTLPGNPNRCPPAKLGFPMAVSGCRVSTSRVSLSPVVAAPLRRRSFVVRAEEEASENAEVVAEEATATEEGAESGAVDAEKKTPRKRPRKRGVKFGNVMRILNKRAVAARDKARPIPDIRVGDVVQLLLEKPNLRRRVARYKGIVMCKQNAGNHTTIRIRRIIGGIGVELVFPLYSPLVQEVKVLSHRKVRRARLYYLRDKLPRFSTFK